jgi:hypothetical protein
LKARRILLLALGVACGLPIVPFLRPVKERVYTSVEAAAPDGAVYAEVDGAWYPMPVRFWFDGEQTDAPYRLRIFYRPDVAGVHQFVVTRVSIDGRDIPTRTRNASWYPESNGRSVAIVGFLDVPISAHESTARVELEVDGRRATLNLRLIRHTRYKIVHSIVEALMGV